MRVYSPSSNKSNNFFFADLSFRSRIEKKKEKLQSRVELDEELYYFIPVLTSYQQRYKHDVGEKGGEVDDFSNGLDATHQTQEADYPSEGQTS